MMSKDWMLTLKSEPLNFDTLQCVTREQLAEIVNVILDKEIEFKMIRGELKEIIDGLQLLKDKMLKGATFNIKTGWLAGSRIANKLHRSSTRAQVAMYGRVIFHDAAGAVQFDDDCTP